MIQFLFTEQEGGFWWGGGSFDEDGSGDDVPQGHVGACDSFQLGLWQLAEVGVWGQD